MTSNSRAGRPRFGRVRSGLLLVVVLGVGCVLTVGLLIGHQVDRAIDRAQQHHPGAPLDALVATATDDDIDLELRDSAIWALGQLGDPAALTTLEGLVSGERCDHANDVCQRGVRRAIEACEGAWNLSAPIWRRGDLAAR